MIGSLVLLAGLLTEGAGLALELQARLPPTGGAELLTIIFSNATSQGASPALPKGKLGKHFVL